MVPNHALPLGHLDRMHEEGRRFPGELSEENDHEEDPFLIASFVSIRFRRWQTDIYVILKARAYVYEAKSNKLNLVVVGDLRSFAGTQAFVTNAPVSLVFVADLAKMGTCEQ